MADQFDQPLDKGRRRLRKARWNSESSGFFAEQIARFTGTPRFLFFLTIFVVLWISWNSLAPEHLRFDSAALGFTALTLMLSLQASYSSPLILLAQNRQDDRDRVNAQQDRATAARNLADTEYLTREIAGLRHAMSELATRDYVRSELRDLLEELGKADFTGDLDDELLALPTLEEEAFRRELSDREETIAKQEARITELEDRIARILAREAIEE